MKPTRVRNEFGVESTIPDDYPEALLKALGLEVVQEGVEDSTPEPQPGEPEAQPRERRRRR